MTTTSQQPTAPEPEPGDRAGRAPGGRPKGLVAAAAVAVIVLVAALGWLLLEGPLSSSARDGREVEQTLKDMSSAETFADFNSHLCAENRVPQDLVDAIMGSGQETGTDVDSMLRESIAGNFPDDLQVTGVELGADGEEATATVESGSGDAETSEEVRMRREDGDWKLCEPGVGMGSVPQQEAPQQGQPG
ncbi:hypothetical protein NCCP2495_31070 [Dietzia sp. NCCP-2495]|uniref:Rv0361 family membrane protein n=1 Tax=Dietzia sp. NCCP-2495 TaxID=2934675 RepID=UPI002230E4B0|nr:hypothetical protein [Dietzia sp. NCCP-2495]GLB65227.1 hypothetical protein NCCP2495_31070 [Dietzia sp. NCCP-2495]